MGRSIHAFQQALIGKCGQPIQRVITQLTHGTGARHLAAGEDRQTPEEAATLLIQESVAPVQRVPQGLLPRGEVAGSAHQQVEC
jgi:hypothetical protein